MELSDKDKRLIAAVQGGLPLVPRPYAEIGKMTGMGEAEVIEALKGMLADGLIRRLGVVVRHLELGYRANAMVAWDVADGAVDEIGRRFGEFGFVTLCYRRRRHPLWPFNLYCMVHGRQRRTVLDQVAELAQACSVADVPRQVLFSVRRFKQRGAVYNHQTPAEDVA